MKNAPPLLKKSSATLTSLLMLFCFASPFAAFAEGSIGGFVPSLEPEEADTRSTVSINVFNQYTSTFKVRVFNGDDNALSVSSDPIKVKPLESRSITCTTSSSDKQCHVVIDGAASVESDYVCGTVYPNNMFFRSTVITISEGAYLQVVRDHENPGNSSNSRDKAYNAKCETFSTRSQLEQAAIATHNASMPDETVDSTPSYSEGFTTAEILIPII